MLEDCKHLEKHAANGINPFTTPIVIDAGASLLRSISSVDNIMTTTKTGPSCSPAATKLMAALTFGPSSAASRSSTQMRSRSRS